MNIAILKSGFVSLVLLLPVGAYAQGIVNGANEGAQQGGNAAGPVGAIVGGAVGAVTGGINGLIGIDMTPRFHRYVVEQHRPSYRVEETVTVGTVLPAEGVEYYEAPAEYGVTQYRYTVVNDEVVLVEPRTRKIVQIVQ